MSTDLIWQSAPLPALRVYVGASQPAVQANAAALQWAAAQGLTEAQLLALADASGAVPTAVRGLRLTPVELQDGALIWLQPASPAALPLPLATEALGLRERQRTQLAINAAGVGVWERDLNGKVLHWNEAMYRMRGFDPASAPPADELMDRLTHPDDRAVLQRVFLSHIQSGQPYRHELRVKGADGQWCWLLTHGQVMRDEQGRVVGMAGINLDITERKRAAELALDKARIEQASRDKSAFMARMSHELRTPMNAVLGFARLIEGDIEELPTPRQRHRLAHISAAGQQLMVLIDDLLETARREAPAPTARVAGALHVLCVEDNPVNLQLVRELLAMRPGVRLRTAEDGASGLAAAHAEPPDLLLLDVQLPDINGLEVMRRLRAEPSMAACRIVALSADAMPDHIEAALAAGFDDYWTKPIQFDRFLAGIDALAQKV